jgi:hypothetical protein
VKNWFHNFVLTFSNLCRYSWVLHDIMAGKRCEMSAKTGTYSRRVDGDTSPLDIESGLQLLHILFTSDVSGMLVPEELEAGPCTS